MNSFDLNVNQLSSKLYKKEDTDLRTEHARGIVPDRIESNYCISMSLADAAIMAYAVSHVLYSEANVEGSKESIVL